MSAPHDPAGDPARSGSSVTLLGRLRVNEADAWRRLVYLYGPLLRAWFGRWGLDGADADDVAQEVFQAMAAGLATFRRDRPGDTFRGWVYGVARIQALQYFRRAGRQPRATGGTEANLRLHDLAAPDEAHPDDPPAELNALYR